MADRIRCTVPHCRRTHRNDENFVDWLCGEHWRLTDKARRRVWGRLKRRWRRFGPSASAPQVEHRLWNALRRQAIERALGI